MKKILLLLLICSTLYVNGQTSVYHPFPNNNAVWNFHLVCLMGAAQADYSITILGDTLINSQTYHKLTTPFVQNISGGPFTCGITTGYKGAIRQDIPNKKVYFVPPANNSEVLLYDFNMQVGDTVKGYIEANTTPKDTVQSIDSVLVGSGYRKRWKINSCYSIYFIEGIGSTYGLIAGSPACMTDQGYYTLTCFSQNNQTLYPDTATNCNVVTAVNSIEKNAGQVSVFPNPSNGSFTIDFDKEDIKEIKLTDLPGRIVFQQHTFNKTRINIDNLLQGVYILTLIDKQDKAMNRKVIIQK